MSVDASWSPTALLLLGAVHGINPAMGWLFAVALGLQERRRGAVWGALLPLALGHALAIAAALAAAATLGAVLPPAVLRWLVAAALLATGARALVRHRHPRWGGMRASARDLTIWSFLMASAHGAGLMVLPFMLGRTASGAAHEAHEAGGAHLAHAALTHATLSPATLLPTAAIGATLAHAAGYLLVTGVVAVVVYERLGLRLLRRAWVNLDLIWAAALVVTAILTLVA